VKLNNFEDATAWGNLDYIALLCKAIMLDKVSIKDGRIMVKAFTEEEIEA
jgi:hypothetical protein